MNHDESLAPFREMGFRPKKVVFANYKHVLKYFIVQNSAYQENCPPQQDAFSNFIMNHKLSPENRLFDHGQFSTDVDNEKV